MTKKSKVGILKKQLGHGAACLVLAAFMLTATAQPAHAQVATLPEQIIQLAELALQYAEQLLQATQTAFGQVTNSVGQELQTQATAEIADTAATNAANNVNRQTAENISVAYTRPSNYSYCHIAEMTAMADNNEQAGSAMAQAYTQGNQQSQANPMVNSQVLVNECTLCFAPLGATDPESSEWTGICAANPCVGVEHVRGDRNVAAVTGPLQYPVDPLAQMPLANGTYQRQTAITPDVVAADGTVISYYLFVEALTFCQHLVPLQPAPPKVPAGKININSLNMTQLLTSGSRMSGVASMCFASLSRRMQFGAANAALWPAGQNNYPGAANIKTRHDEQVAECTEANAAGYIDDTILAECQTYGRSELQLQHDRAYANEFGNYQTTVQAYLPTAEAASDTATNNAAEVAFKRDLEAERLALVNATQQFNQTKYFGDLTTPIN